MAWTYGIVGPVVADYLQIPVTEAASEMEAAFS
jgi:hypothetical protein